MCIAGGGVFRFIHHGVGATLFQRFGGEGVSVEVFAFQGDEERALRAVAAVCADAGALPKNTVERGNVHNRCMVS